MKFNAGPQWIFLSTVLHIKVEQVLPAPAFVPFDVDHYHEFNYIPPDRNLPRIPIGDPLELYFIDHMKTRPLATTDFVHTHHRQWRKLEDINKDDDDDVDEDDNEDGEDDKEDNYDEDEDEDDNEGEEGEDDKEDNDNDEEDDIDPLESAGLFEGDIVVYSKAELSNLVHGRRPHMRSALTPPEMLWPDGVVPYIIADTFSDYERRQIGKAMEAYHDLTCIRFVPRGAEHTDYLIMYQGKGCSSGVGRRGGPQSLSLASRCVNKKTYGTILHEFMHALGFEHEQARYDRDLHITINWDNIDPKKRFNFGMRPSGPTTTLGLAYDYNSLMHYGPKFFAVNRSIDTITPDSPGAVIGNRIDFSELDLKGINSLYDCDIPNIHEELKSEEIYNKTENTLKDKKESKKEKKDKITPDIEKEEKKAISKHKRKHRKKYKNHSTSKRRKTSKKGAKKENKSDEHDIIKASKSKEDHEVN